MAARWLPEAIRRRLRQRSRGPAQDAPEPGGLLFTADRPAAVPSAPATQTPPPPAPAPVPQTLPPPGPRETPPGTPDEPAPAPAGPPSGPAVHVHDGRLDERVGPLELSPSQALALAKDGPDVLRRPRPRAQ